MPDSTLSQALKEAYAAARCDVVTYHTLELNHAAFVTPIRVVRDYTDLTAKLENGATVSFVALPFEIMPPEVNTVGVPQCTLELDNISREIVAYLELAMTSNTAISVTYRLFLSSHLTVGPQNNPPMTLQITAITADAFKVRATATFGDLVNRRFPAQDYTLNRFPGLAR